MKWRVNQRWPVVLRRVNYLASRLIAATRRRSRAWQVPMSAAFSGMPSLDGRSARTDTATFGGVRITARTLPSASPFAIPEGSEGALVLAVGLGTPPGSGRRLHAIGSAGALIAPAESLDPAALPAARYQLAVSLPGSLLGEVGLGDTSPLALDTSNALFWPFVAFGWEAALSYERTSGLTAYYLERVLQEMVLGITVASLGRAEPARVGLYAAAISVVTARAGDPDLTPMGVASELNVSLRTLQRLFAQQDSTVEREIRRARVKQALTMLDDPAYDVLSIDRVAQSAGLSGGSSLARAFAAEGHPSPSVVRKSRYREGFETPSPIA